MKRFLSIATILLLAVAGVRAATFSGHEVAHEGAWCWFADPRAVHYENAAMGINMTYIGYIDAHGSIKAMQYDFNRNSQTEVLIRSWFQPDDHDNPTFLALPDGRIMVFYSRHTDEPCFYYRISRVAGDITTLGKEKIIKTKDNTTYPSPFILSADPEHIYLCWRGINWHPTIARLTLPDSFGNVEIEDGPYQIVQSTGARPYAKYMSNGKDRIYLAYTTGHPDNEYPDWLYFNYIQVPSLKLTDVKGNALSSVRDSVFHIYKTDAYKTKYPLSVVDSDPQERDWLWQIAADKKGRPAIAMVHISNDKQSHRYYYAKWTGRQWRKTFIGDGGRFFHQSPEIENCYSSGMAIDPANANSIYVSLPTEGQHGLTYELFNITLNDDGDILSKEAITHDSPQNNIRPYMIPNSENSPLRLVWMHGKYYDWIVSKQRPEGYPTSIHCDFGGFNEPVNLANGLIASTEVPNGDFTLSVNVRLNPQKYYGSLFRIGTMEYFIEASTMFPGIRINGKIQRSNNILGTADTWKLYPRGTGGLWYDPVKYTSVNIIITFHNGTLRSYVNGLLDQTIEQCTFTKHDVAPFYPKLSQRAFKIYDRVLNFSEIRTLSNTK